MDMRELKALELAARAKIAPADDGTWRVPSQSTGGTYRVVTWPGAESCECEDFQLRQAPCKHIIAARLVEERDRKKKAPPIDTDAPAPKRPTHKQNWPAYDLAQTQEKHRLQVLLADLCRGVTEPEYKTGRPPLPLADRIFACAFKVYCGMSHRRFGCDLADAADRGHLSRPVHFTKVAAYMADADMTPILRELVALSALPLRSVESRFAVDSSGFSTSKFVRWFDEKYGVERSGRDWVKVHICTGVTTNVVTAVEVRDRDANDCPILGPLVRQTANGFIMQEVSADKGYLSAENVDIIAGVGGVPFIAPKCNTTGASGGRFAEMFHYYQFRRQDFLKHYHQRSNVESTFSAIKRKLGDYVRSKGEAAMANEVLCKILCHNLTCVILSQIELGIDAIFWPDQDEGRRDVLPLARGAVASGRHNA